MVRDPKDEISIDAPKTDFEKFLSEDNKRIFFSGRFGIGKTFFLQKFFEQHTSEYDVYHLFPVNYQISSNENIVEFLKYDILVELLKKYPEAFKSKELNGLGEKLRFFAAFCKDRGIAGRLSKATIKSLFGLTPDPIFTPLSRLGRSLKDLTTFREEFQEFKAEQLSGDRDAIDEFLEKIETQADIVATDYVSQLLREKIETLKENKRSVLILDDFDRIDPEHTFRILNILSAHIESDEQNKFGFDHIIIVGDIDNLRNIFRHKYGEKTDFWGYFDKFFTVEPYYFDNEKAISDVVYKLASLIKYEEPELKPAMEHLGIINNLLEEVLKDAFTVKAMNLRQLYKPIDHTFPEMRKGMFPKGPDWSTASQAIQCLNISVKLLLAIYGSKTDLLKALVKISDNVSDTPIQGMDYVFRLTANPMFKRMFQFKEVGNELWLGKYTLVVTDENLDGSGKSIVPKDGAHARFFYDTLCEYIKRSEYKNDRPRAVTASGNAPVYSNSNPSWIPSSPST